MAGPSGRYNNIQIDGAVNNDLFGLAAHGTPGGQANTQPTSVDAVSELQLVVAPYDVRQSRFSGGGIKVITRSGANRFSGTAYLYSPNDGLVGRGIDDVPIATFFDRQQGANVGGPLVRNRAFFFANAAAGDAGRLLARRVVRVDFGRLAEGRRIVDVARTRYGYDIPGGFGEIVRGNPNDKIFLRSDLNLSAAHRLSVRHNDIDAHRRLRVAVELPLPLRRQLLPVPQPDPLDRRPAQTARSAPPRTWRGSATSGFATAGDRGPPPSPRSPSTSKGARRSGSAPSSSRPRTRSIRTSSRSTTT